MVAGHGRRPSGLGHDLLRHAGVPAREPPLYGAAFRAVPAGLLLLAVCRKLPRGSWWWKSLVLGALNMSGFFALVYVAAQRLPTSLASIIMALAPLFMMMLAWPWSVSGPAGSTSPEP